MWCQVVSCPGSSGSSSRRRTGVGLSGRRNGENEIYFRRQLKNAGTMSSLTGVHKFGDVDSVHVEFRKFPIHKI